MATLPPLLTDLRTLAAYSEGAGIHRIIPAGVAVPGTVEEVRSLVLWAAASGTTLVPRGAGSAMPGDAVGPGVIVDLSQGFRRLDIDVEARIAVTVAGVPVVFTAWGRGLPFPERPHREQRRG